MSIFKRKYVFLYPPIKARLDALDDIVRGVSRPEKYLFYGLDFFLGKGLSLVHNLQPVSLSKLQTFILILHRKICGRLFLSYGEIEWTFPVFTYLFRSPLLFVFSERIMLAICYWRLGRILPQRPTVFMPIGLPEKMKFLKEKRPWMFKAVIGALRKIEKIVCVSSLEAQQLYDIYGLGNTMFVPAGVDSEYFSPINGREDVDVMSIGADKFRDFELLIESARRLKDFSFCIITTSRFAQQFADLPGNIEVLTDVPMAEIRSHIARGKILALPVIPNSYSGATTVLLQAMSMGKAVIANQEGANKAGYPFYHKRNLWYVKSCDLDELNVAISRLLVDPALRERIGEEARKTVLEDLRIEDFHAKLYEILDEVHRQVWGSKMSGW